MRDFVGDSALPDGKEEYVKPDFEILTFGSTSLSASCRYEAAFQLYDCPLDVGGVKIFSDINVCEFTDAGGKGKICAHVSVDEEKVFGS